LSTVVRGRRSNFRPERDGNVVHACVPVLKNFPQKWVRALFSFPPARLLWNAMLFVWLKVLLRATGFHSSDRVLYVSNVYYATILPLLSRKLMLYDCNDDPLSFPNVPGWVSGCFGRVARDADIVTAVSAGLVERLKEAGAEDAVLLGNGVDYEMFQRSAAAGIPGDMENLGRPVIGYAGAIAQWFDFELVETIAKRFPGASIALIGPVFREVEWGARRLAEERRNVVFLGEKNYDDLGAYLSSMDVCIIPLEANELRRLADPNKLYEYAAVGRPIVTMAYSDYVTSLDGLVYVARSRGEFVDKVEEALGKGDDSEALREFARARSWQSRADEMTRLIDEAITG
ncbi:MAG: glycosyltransferase, partial [Candidatus Krumholzibacteria bacterium]|nr:glycosyltransferase [Candidatus Krumholzibacteria bacterium]